MESPSKEEIRLLRAMAGLTQTASGALLHVGIRAWQKWEGGDHQMHPAFWELYTIKTEALRLRRARRKAAQDL